MPQKNITPQQVQNKTLLFEKQIKEVDSLSEEELWSRVVKIDNFLKTKAAGKGNTETKYISQTFRENQVSRFTYEQIIVGVCLRGDKQHFKMCQNFINPAWFKETESFAQYNDKTEKYQLQFPGISKKIYTALCSMVEDGFDPRNYHELHFRTAIPFSAIISLAEASFYIRKFSQFVTYTKAMEEIYLGRQLINIASDIEQEMIKDKVELKLAAEKIVFPAEKEEVDMIDVSMEILAKHESTVRYRKTGERDPNAILFGIEPLDKFTGGMKPGKMVVVAARPAMGKSTFLRQVVKANAPYRPVLFFSLEMTKHDIHELYACNLARLNSFRVSKSSFREGEVAKFIQGLSDATKMYIPKDSYSFHKGIKIDDRGSLDLADMERTIATFCEACEVPPLIAIDYLTLIKGDEKQKRNDLKVAAISNSIRELAKVYNAGALVLSQLSRAVESRAGDRRPILSDLRETGKIEEDGEKVMFLYRPEYYGFETDDEGNSTLGKCEIIVAKNRSGPTGTVHTQYIPDYGGDFYPWFKEPIPDNPLPYKETLDEIHPETDSPF